MCGKWLLAGIGVVAVLMAGAVVSARGVGLEAGRVGAPDAEIGDAGAELVSVFLLLGEQADLTSAATIEDWTARGRAVYAALSEVAGRTQPRVLNRLARLKAAGHVQAVQPLWIVNAIAVRADAETLKTLAAWPEVARIVPNRKLEPPGVEMAAGQAQAPAAVEWGVSKIRAPEVWTTYQVNGAGAVAANVDTGVDFTHPALVNQYRGNLSVFGENAVSNGVFDHNFNWYDPTGVHPAPVAVEGSHGTHVMGTEVGWDGGANQIGVAPGATWIAAYGCCPDNLTLLLAQQFMLAPTDLAGNNANPALRPHVLNQSWGGPGGSEIFQPALAALRASGIFSSISAGNMGSACGTLGSPGDNPLVFSVGSTDSSDAIAGSSSRGPNPFSGRTGPEVSAPGVMVRSSIAGGGYQNYSGTSMAAPHVAGAVALLISLEPRLAGQVEQIEELLRKTAVPRTSTQSCGGVAGSAVPNNAFGWGRLDVKAAADLVWQAGYLAGRVTSSGLPMAGATVTFSRMGKSLTTMTHAEGDFRVVAGAGVWTVEVKAFGYAPALHANVTVSQDQTTAVDTDLAALPAAVVHGRVTDSITGVGVPALVMLANEASAAPVFADASGMYSLPVPATTRGPVATVDITAQHPGFHPLTQSAAVSGTVALDFSLSARPNYTCLDDRQPGGPVFNWQDASDGVTYHLGDDASTAFLPLAQPFTYFGTPYTTVTVNSNGYIYFTNAWWSRVQMMLPFEGPPNAALTALGEDLNPAQGTQGLVYVKSTANAFIAQWQAVEHWASGDPETFEIILDLPTGAVTYQYQTLSWPDYTTVGLEDAAGSVGQLYSYANSAGLQAGRAVRFTPASGNGVSWGCDHAYTLTAAPVVAANTVTYHLHWNEVGFGGAASAVLTATVPASSTFVAASGGVQPQGGVLTWSLGNLRPRASGQAWFTVRPHGAQALTTATISDQSGQARTVTTAASAPGMVWMPMMMKDE
ncbi:MAG: S8 family serine peptidase [Anaerolineae bacterium]